MAILERGIVQTDLTERMDAELISAYQKIPSEGFVDWDDLPATREFFVRMHHELTAGTPDSENVVKEDRSVPGPEGASEVPVRVYRPSGAQARYLGCSGSTAAATCMEAWRRTTSCASTSRKKSAASSPSGTGWRPSIL